MGEWTHKQLRGKKWAGQPFDVLQHKLNGWRATIFKQEDGTVKIYGKDHRPHLEFVQRFPRTKFLEMPEIELFQARAKPFTSVDCEILASGDVCSDVVHHLTEGLPVTIEAFAVPHYKGATMYGESIGWANDVAQEWGFKFAQYHEIDYFPSLKVATKLRDFETIDRIKKALLEKSNALGIEGWMLKSGGQYGRWFKVKPADPVDCVITGVIDAEPGKFEGMIGSIVCSVYRHGKLIEIASASGMNDAVRAEMTCLHKDDMLRGLVVELKYQMIGAEGRLMHPRFSRWRPDKPMAECTYDQLESEGD